MAGTPIVRGAPEGSTTPTGTINPFTGKVDTPVWVDSESGDGGDRAIAWRDASGNVRFVSSYDEVRDVVDPTTGQTVKAVVNKDTGFYSEADTISAGLGAAYNQQHQLTTRTAGDNVTVGADGSAQVNTGTSPTAVGISGIINKTLVPAGERLGLLPDGSGQTFTNIRNAADAARAAGKTTAPGAGVNVTTGGGGTGGTGGGAASVDTSALATSIAQANALRDQYNVAVANNAPPQVQAALINQIAQAQGGAPVTARDVAAAQVGAYQAAVGPGQIQAGVSSAGQAQAQQIANTILAQQQAAIQAERVAAAQAERTVLGPTALASRTQLAPTALAEQTPIERAEQAQIRLKQLGLMEGLQGAIDGKDPSVAAIMLRQATERNIGQQYGLAQAATGMNTGLAQRQAMNNAADLNQQAIGQQALLRAQEIATARGQMAGVLQGTRESDIGLASNEASLSQQVKLANAGFTNTANMTQAQLDQAVQLANAGFKNTATTTQAQLDAAQRALNVQQMNAVNTANADRGLAASTTNATLAQQVALANAAAQNNTNQVNAQLGTQTSIANAGYQTQSSIANANNVTSANQTSASLAAAIAQSNARNQLDQQLGQARLTQEASLANSANALAADTTNSTLSQALNIFNTGQTNQVNTTNANNQTSVNQTNGTFNIQQQQIDALARQNAASNTLRAQEIATQAGIGAANAQAQAAAGARDQQRINQAQATQDWNQTKDLATAAWAISDREKKENISSGSADIEQLLSSLKEYKFNYKDPSAPGTAPGDRYGVMAQDLEKSPAGKSLVVDTPDGKMVNTSQAVLAALAAVGNVNRRLKNIERRAA